MSMTRKEFNLAADQLAEWSDAPEGKLFTKEDVVYEFIKFFKQTNPRFDASRFVKACKSSDSETARSTL